MSYDLPSAVRERLARLSGDMDYVGESTDYDLGGYDYFDCMSTFDADDYEYMQSLV